MSVEGVHRQESWRPALALLAALAASQLFAPALIGLAALAMAIACLSIVAERRFEVASNILVWVLAAIIFGPSGAGCLILAHAIVALAAAAMGRRLLPVTVVAATACVFLPPMFPGSLSAEIIAVLAIGAPGLALARQASATDRDRFERVRCIGAVPQLLAVVAGAAIAGLPGAAAAVAAGWLMAPMAALLGARTRPGQVMASFGIIAAGLSAALALESLRPLTPAPLTLFAGAVAGYAALRLHAPAAARLLRRTARRTPAALRPPRPALAR